MKKVFVVFSLLLLVSCGGGAKNPTVRNDIKSQIKDHLALGVEAFATGNLQSSESYLTLALNEAKLIDNMGEQINVLINLGSVYIAQGLTSKASNMIFTAVDMIRYTGIHNYDFNVKIVLGKYYSRMEMMDMSIKAYKQALRLAKQPNQQAIAYNNLGIILRKTGNNKEALWNLNRAKAINKRKKFYDQLANNHYNIAEIYFEQNDWNNAQRNFMEALTYDKISENPLGIVDDLKRLAEISFTRGNTFLGDHYFARALSVAQSAKSEYKVNEIKALIKKYSKTPQKVEPKKPVTGTTEIKSTGTSGTNAQPKIVQPQETNPQ